MIADGRGRDTHKNEEAVMAQEAAHDGVEVGLNRGLTRPLLTTAGCDLRPHDTHTKANVIGVALGFVRKTAG